MKLSLSIDLEPLRQRAMAEVDAAYAAIQPDPVAAIHAAKADMAAARDPRLKAEADARGMSLETLCLLILVKRREVEDELLRLDAERLAVKERIRAAQSEQEIRALTQRPVA